MEFFKVTPNPINGTHNPVGLKYITHLRVGLNHPCTHKYQHNFGSKLLGPPSLPVPVPYVFCAGSRDR